MITTTAHLAVVVERSWPSRVVEGVEKKRDYCCYRAVAVVVATFQRTWIAAKRLGLLPTLYSNQLHCWPPRPRPRQRQRLGHWRTAVVVEAKGQTYWKHHYHHRKPRCYCLDCCYSVMGCSAVAYWDWAWYGWLYSLPESDVAVVVAVVTADVAVVSCCQKATFAIAVVDAALLQLLLPLLAVAWRGDGNLDLAVAAFVVAEVASDGDAVAVAAVVVVVVAFACAETYAVVVEETMGRVERVVLGLLVHPQRPQQQPRRRH
jgi:hypothetical protein